MFLKEIMESLDPKVKRKKKKKADAESVRNFVAKHAQTSGAGAHEDKQGKHANRQRQKKQWKKEEGME